MGARRAAAVTAVLGGLVWGAMAVWDRVAAGEGLVQPLYLAGLGLLALSLVAAGYAVVARAPVWLRLVVAAALPLLVVMVFQLVDQAVGALLPADSWLAEHAAPLGGAVVALVLGGWALARRGPAPADPEPEVRAVRGRRAAR